MQRSSSIDTFKAISIFGVVYIHSADLIGCNSEISDSFRSLFRFAVPFFIIIWAYFIEKAMINKSSFERVKYLIYRFKHMFIIFLIWSTLYFFISVKWETLTPIKLLTTYFTGYGWSGQYYFIILFQLLIFFPIIRWIYTKKKIIVFLIFTTVLIYFIVSNLVLPSILYSIGYRLFIYWIPYVITGIWLANSKNIEIEPLTTVLSEKNKINLRKNSWWLLTIFFIPIESWLMTQFNIFNDLNEYVRPTVLLVSIIISIIVVIHIKLKNNLFANLGKKTMIIFVSNPLVIYLLKVIMSVFGYTPTINCCIFFQIIIPFISSVLVIFICLLIDKLIKAMGLSKILI